MDQQQWQLIERLFHEALDYSWADRQAFLDASCPDREIRLQVESLLAESGDDRLTPMAAAVAADWAAATDDTPIVGCDIGGYRILSLIAAGGMGEVYLADDPSLGRKVALKLLPHAYVIDPDRVRRFSDEARAASALNHPGILTVYQVGECDGRRFIATEYVDGETVRERLARGPLPADEATAIAIQAAGALRAAHDAGIVHRDIKPENLMVRRDGYVKVLDFGVAKLMPQDAIPSGDNGWRTRAGAVLGTRDYMAPEQAMGGEVDGRADIYSLCVVLHEMLTGTRPRASTSPGDARPPVVPAPLARILSRGLALDPAARYASVADLRRELERARPSVMRHPRSWRPVAIAGAAAAIVAAIAVAGATIRARLVARDSRVHSVAVLPFRSLDRARDEAYLELGMADAIITRLGAQDRLSVPPTAAVRGTADPFDAGRRLGVDAVLTGTLQRSGDRLRVTVQLSRVDDRAQIWAGRFDEQLTDDFAVQDSIARRIADDLVREVSPTDRIALPRRDTGTIEAHELRPDFSPRCPARRRPRRPAAAGSWESPQSSWSPSSGQSWSCDRAARRNASDRCSSRRLRR